VDAKLARREGIDFVLDAMGQHIHDQLQQHIDELRTVTRRASAKEPVQDAA
jgi:uncharacterized LabA/DUF88 family protein